MNSNKLYKEDQKAHLVYKKKLILSIIDFTLIRPIYFSFIIIIIK